VCWAMRLVDSSDSLELRDLRRVTGCDHAGRPLRSESLLFFHSDILFSFLAHLLCSRTCAQGWKGAYALARRNDLRRSRAISSGRHLDVWDHSLCARLF
jgi:hypothetical protein